MSNVTSYPERSQSAIESTLPTSGLRESFNWIIVGAGAYLLLALITYNPQDPGWSYVGPHDVVVQNAGGMLGAWCADVLMYLFGYLAFLIPSIIIWRGLIAICCNNNYLAERILFFALRGMGFIATLITGAMLAELYIHNSILPFPAGTGGAVGQFLTPLLLNTLQPLGSVLSLVTTFAIGFTILSGLSWLKLIDTIGALVCTIAYWIFWPILILISIKKKATPILEETIPETSLTNSNPQPTITTEPPMQHNEFASPIITDTAPATNDNVELLNSDNFQSQSQSNSEHQPSQ